MPFETPSLPVLIKRTQSDLASDSLRQSDAQVLAVPSVAPPMACMAIWTGSPSRSSRTRPMRSTLERIAALRLNQPRKAAQAASGSVSFTASAGAVLDVDTLLQSSDGRT